MKVSHCQILQTDPILSMMSPNLMNRGSNSLIPPFTFLYVPSFSMENVSTHMVSSKGIQIVGRVYAPLMGVQGKDL